MRQAPSRPPSCDPAAGELREALEHAGWRFTRQRAAVYKQLLAAHGHPTAEEVYDCVRRDLPKISLATVYKALEALVDCRLATKLTSSDGPSRYDCRGDAHYHLRCTKTNQVRDLDVPYDDGLLDKLHPQLVAALRRQGFEVTGYRLEVLGQFTDG